MRQEYYTKEPTYQDIYGSQYYQAFCQKILLSLLVWLISLYLLTLLQIYVCLKSILISLILQK